MDMSELEYIKGAGGGGGDSHTPVEAPNSLVSKTTARVLFLTSDGEVGGLADQTNKLKSVYFNNVPVMNSDGSTNFSNVQLDERFGLPSQTVMTGYPSASSTFNLGSKVTTSTAVTYTSSNSAVDAIRVTVRFPALFQQETNGDTNGTSVQFQIYTALGAGSFSLIRTITKTDKCISPADVDYLINRPAGTGTWAVKVVRATADNASSTKANDIYFQTAAEIQYAQLPYNGRAYVGMTVTAEATGSSFPLIAYDVYGIKVKVPSNYNVATRVYTGGWDGTFSATKQVCDNPAWVLYDLLTNASHGLGAVIAESDVDKYSFYDAAVYNDATVPALVNGSISGTEPRYRFNYQFMEQQGAWETVQSVAASFGACVYTSGNRVKLVQERPTAFSRVITNSNVIDGMFEYMSSQMSTRQTQAIVYWNNPAENFLSVPCQYSDSTGVTRYGLNSKEIVGLGVTSEGQALRLAKWHVDTSLNNTETVTFKVGFANAGMEPGEVMKVMDTSYASVMGEAKVVSSTSTTVTLDRAIDVASGNTFDVVGADGVTLETRTITSTGTGLTTISYSGVAITASKGADFVLTGTIAPRLFKITGVREESPGVYTVSALQYDPNKFGRVDSTPTGNVPVYQSQAALVPSAPLGLTFREASINDNNQVRRSLLVSWSRPATGNVKSFVFRFRRNYSSWEQLEQNTSSYEFAPAADGLYEVEVFARNAAGTLGPQATGTYTVSLTGGGASALAAPTNLQVIGGGTSFSGLDINLQFTNPTANGVILGATLRDFEVRYIETTGSTTVRTLYVPAVVAGQNQTTSYTYAMNTQDGGPRRTMQVQVRCRDTNNNLSNPVTVTFTNPVPAVPSGITITGALQSNKITMSMPTDPDFLGILIWRSTTSGFTPSSGNLIYDGSDAYIADNALSDATTYYYKVAAYDQFSKDLAGAGLTISGQFTATTSAAPGVAKGSSLPGSAAQGDLFFLTTDNKLYRYTGSAWTAAVPTVDLTGTVTAAQIASLTAGQITGTLSDSQLAAISATKITGQIVGTQITDGSISTVKIAANAITTDKLIVTGRGKALNDDPSCRDLTAWTLGSGAIATQADTTSPVGQYSIRGTSAMYFYSRNFPIEAGKTYKVAAWVKQVSGTGTLYLRLLSYNSAGTLISYIVNGITPSGTFEGATVPGVWTKYVGYITPAAGSVYAQAEVHLNWGGTGTADITDIRVEEYVGADLIVDGSITATKIAADTITAAQIAANAITSSELAANSVVAGKIAAGVVTASEVQAGSLTGDRLTANTITGDKVAASTITATNIDSRNLTIKDAGGTVVFSAGVPLTSSYITPSSGWVNSNVSLSANGTLNGAGGGAVTAAGIGATSVSLNVRGTGLVLAGNSCNRPSGGGAWDADCYSIDSYVGGAWCSFVPGAGTSSYFMAGLNTDPLTDTSYGSIDYAFYMANASTLYVYESGSSIGAVGTYANTDVLSIQYDGQFVRYFQNGTLLRIVAAAPGIRFYFDSSIVYYGLSNIQLGPMANTTYGRASNLIDASWWKPGATFKWGDANGAGSTTDFVNAVMPDGTSQTVMRGTAGAGGSGVAGGGWNPNSDPTNRFPVDTSKTYMFVTYFYKASNGSAAGTEYFGIEGSSVCDLNTTTVNTNPYFAATGLTVGRWYMFVGKVFPYGSSGNTSTNAGAYDCTNGQYIAGGTNYNWNSVSSAATRAFQYYTASGVVYIARPQVYQCDGSEPSIDALLASASPSARNPISAGNASTYIANAAIGSAQVGTLTAGNIGAGTIDATKISVSSLQAVSATIGTLRTASSGARTELSDNVFKVYDSSGVLRVKIGNLDL